MRRQEEETRRCGVRTRLTLYFLQTLKARASVEAQSQPSGPFQPRAHFTENPLGAVILRLNSDVGFAEPAQAPPSTNLVGRDGYGDGGHQPQTLKTAVRECQPRWLVGATMSLTLEMPCIPCTGSADAGGGICAERRRHIFRSARRGSGAPCRES